MTSTSVTIRTGRRGTVVIPAAMRRRLGIDDGTMLTAEETDDGLILRPIRTHSAADREAREVLLKAMAAEYEVMERDHGEAWAAMLAEQAEWDVTLMDGLDPTERWDEHGFPVESPGG